MNNFIANLRNIQFPSFSTLQVYVDLGTTKTSIAVRDRGIALREASCIGLNRKTSEFIFFGQEAKMIIGKVPSFITIIKPIVNGIISDFDAQVALVRNLINKAISPYLSNYFLKPGLEIVTAVPSAATEIEQKAVSEVFTKIGATSVHLIEKPLATALGCDVNVFTHKPVFIVDMGGGLIELAVISGRGTVTYRALKNAGENMNKLIYNYIYLKYGIILGEITCEELKINLLNFKDEEKTIVVRGKSLETGLPKSAKVRTSDIKEALLTNINQILDAIKEVMEVSPPEIVDEIYTHGLILTGGLSNIPGIDIFFSNELKIEAHVAAHPENSTVNGLFRIGKNRDALQALKINLP